MDVSASTIELSRNNFSRALASDLEIFEERITNVQVRNTSDLCSVSLPDSQWRRQRQNGSTIFKYQVVLTVHAAQDSKELGPYQVGEKLGAMSLISKLENIQALGMLVQSPKCSGICSFPDGRTHSYKPRPCAMKPGPCEEHRNQDSLLPPAAPPASESSLQTWVLVILTIVVLSVALLTRGGVSLRQLSAGCC